MAINLFWLNYWKTKTCGDHRSQAEQFLEKEAQEKLFHLNGGNSLLDFGCGSADLFVYYSQVYQVSVGVDFSEKMLESAKKRLAQFNAGSNVLLVQSDDLCVWKKLADHMSKQYKFDRITAGQVTQYLDHSQIESFVGNALNHLSDDGLICFFDVVDCRTYELWNADLFKGEYLGLGVLLKLALGRLRAFRNQIRRGVPGFDIGYMYPPSFFEMLANKYHLQFCIVHSMYYEYRYHVILKHL